MYLFGVKYCYNLDRLQIACCHLVFVKKSPSFQNVDIFPELDRCTPCVFICTVACFSRNKSLLISFGAPVIIQSKRYVSNIDSLFYNIVNTNTPYTDFIFTICGGYKRTKIKAEAEMKILGLPFTKTTAFVDPVSSVNPMYFFLQ